jgi:polyphosphate kinase
MSVAAPNRYLNRELSWLEFNQRVLDEALDEANPLLERVKFFCIASSNLDEFFEVRVAGLKQSVQSAAADRSPDGMSPRECLRAIARQVRAMVDAQYACWRERLVPQLARHGIRFLSPQELDATDLAWLDRFYRAEVRPVLTPLAIDPAHPFPQLLNKSLNLIVQVRAKVNGRNRTRLAVVQAPRILPRLVQLPRENGAQDCVFLGRLIGHYLADLFPGTQILGYWFFRVTRNSELYIDEEEFASVRKAVETELHRRLKGEAVRLEVQTGCPPHIRDELLRTLHLGPEDLYAVDGPLDPSRLAGMLNAHAAPELCHPPFLAPIVPALRAQPDVFAAIRAQDILLHHPYESFESVVAFVEQAAADPRVLAIKQTLYRTGGDARIIGALMDAVKNGKQVTAVVELKARFDEANNLKWSRRLEEAGVHVVYGLVGYKIHCKVTLVVRRDHDGIRRYVHLGTGNYNPVTARLYTDLGLLTCHPDYGEDATALFNLLTGICRFQETRKFLVAPYQLHERLCQAIAREADHARRSLPARIIAKMNSLVDTPIIDALYAASQAGVRIDLIVRGICCLRPGIKGLSENITVRSIVGRFLEHSRIVYFDNACQPELYIGSADWMPRNFYRRIEVLFPVESGALVDRIVGDLESLVLRDNVKARQLQPDGSYRRVRRAPGQPVRNSQAELIRAAQRAAQPSPATGGDASRPPPIEVLDRPPQPA